jgi:hypothetical protein
VAAVIHHLCGRRGIRQRRDQQVDAMEHIVFVLAALVGRAQIVGPGLRAVRDFHVVVEVEHLAVEPLLDAAADPGSWSSRLRFASSIAARRSSWPSIQCSNVGSIAAFGRSRPYSVRSTSASSSV